MENESTNPSSFSKNPKQPILENLITNFSQERFDYVLKEANKLLSDYPTSFKLWNILGAVNTQMQKTQEAMQCYEKAIELRHDYAEAHNNLGNLLKNEGQHEKAIISYKKALEIKSDLYDANYNLGVIFQEREDYPSAMTCYYKVLDVKHDYENALNNLGNLYREIGEYEKSLNTLNKAAQIHPKSAEIKNSIGLTCRSQGHLDKAITSYKEAISLNINFAEAHNNLGIIFREQGDFKKAINSYKKAIEINPKYAEAYANISKIKKYENNDIQIDQMEKIYSTGNMKEKTACVLAFALGKVYGDIGDNEKAFTFLKEGNALRKKLLNYNISEDQLLFSQIKTSFELINEFQINITGKELTTTPIFILGMPRSGTTLVEQIISCHSKVSGAGELEFCSQYGLPLIRGNIKLNKESLKNFRNQYLNEIKKISNGKPFITDKMPSNFKHIGLIRTAFPEAKIIHVNRDPKAVCWSNFKLDFSSKGLGYSYDLKDLIEYHRLYKDLMNFWKKKYGDFIYQLDYEELTGNQEKETRNLIEFTGLPWEDACLSPEKNKRSVRTASTQQVRKKVYKGSSEEWKKFEPLLNGAFNEII